MVSMRTLLTTARSAVLTVALIAGLIPAAAQASPRTGTQVFEGNVVHVSSNNIKVANPGQTLSFLLVPHFDRVFSDDGKTTQQMAVLRPGRLVKVYYDQKGLGVRHADRILILNRREYPVRQTKG
jgi:hypothetical protein